MNTPAHIQPVVFSYHNKRKRSSLKLKITSVTICVVKNKIDISKVKAALEKYAPSRVYMDLKIPHKKNQPPVDAKLQKTIKPRPEPYGSN